MVREGFLLVRLGFIEGLLLPGSSVTPAPSTLKMAFLYKMCYFIFGKERAFEKLLLELTHSTPWNTVGAQ